MLGTEDFVGLSGLIFFLRDKGGGGLGPLGLFPRSASDSYHSIRGHYKATFYLQTD